MNAIRSARPIFTNLIRHRKCEMLPSVRIVTKRNFGSFINRIYLSTSAPSTELKAPSNEPQNSGNQRTEEQKIPIKAVLLTMEARLTEFSKLFMKKKMTHLYEIISNDVEFEDKKYGFNTRGLQDFHLHIAKIRMYFNFKSPYNKFELIGTAIYEDQNYITTLYRLSSLRANLMTTYNPFYFIYSFIRKKHENLQVLEGALDFYVNEEGLISKVVSREASIEDIEGAKQFSQLKKESEEEFKKRFEADNTPVDLLDWRRGLRKT